MSYPQQEPTSGMLPYYHDMPLNAPYQAPNVNPYEGGPTNLIAAHTVWSVGPRPSEFVALPGPGPMVFIFIFYIQLELEVDSECP
jgi:hypothetical protein